MFRQLTILLNSVESVESVKSSKCNGCPFNDGLTEEASLGQNWGCLPPPNEMVEYFDSSGVAISCHGNEKKACSGLSEVRDTSSSPIKSHRDWFEGK